MNNFKARQKVKRVRDHKYHPLFQHNTDAVFTVAEVSDYEGIRLEGCTKGTWYDEDYFELYQEPAQIAFNPKPGDLIVTEGEGTWVCVDRSDKRFAAYQNYNFFGIRGSLFQGWMTNGSPHMDGDPLTHISQRFTVKEIIPASGNNPVAIPQSPQDLSFQVKALELENQMLRKLLRREGVEV